MKRALLTTLAVALLVCGFAAPVRAETKPVVTVSVNALQELLSDSEYLAALAGPDGKPHEQAAALLKMGPEMLKDFDLTKPSGAVFSLDEQGTPIVIAFVPVKNFDQALEFVAGQFGQKVEDLEGGFKKVSELVVKSSGGYAFIAQQKDFLAELPDPAKVLGGLDKTYDVALSINIQNIPELFRGMAINFLNQGVTEGLKQEENETDAQFEMRREIATQQVKTFERVLNETDSLLVGFSIDQTGKKVLLDIAVTALAGTKMAKQMAQLGDAATQFAPLVLPKAPFSVNAASVTTDEEEIERGVAQINAYREAVMDMIQQSEDIDSDEERALFKELAGEGMDVLKGLIEGGKLDFGIVLTKDEEGPFEMLAALHVPDAKKLEALVKKLIKMGQETEDNFPEVKLDLETYKGVSLHSVIPPAPKENAEKVAKLVGPKPIVALGFSEDTFWAGAGTGVIDSLKAAIDGSGADAAKKIAPSQISLSVLPFIKAANEVEENPISTKLLTATEPGSDRIRIFSEVIENGARSRIEVEAGIIKLIALGVEAVGENAAATFDNVEAELKAE